VWSIARSYGGGTWAWDTSALASTGNYLIDVWVRDAGSGVAYQANALLPYAISAAPPCSSASLTSDKASPQLVGTTVTFTATSTGCAQPQYLFYVQAPGDVWRVAQAYGGPTFVWSSIAPAGTYKVDVWVRQAGSGAAYQAFQLIYYTLTPAAACANAALSSDKTTPQQAGTIITFTATSTGCPNPEYLFYVQDTTGIWTLAQGYDGATFVWNTAGLPIGTYHVDVWARQHGDNAAYEAFQNNAYTLVVAVPCANATLTPDKASPQPASTVVTYTASTTGCSQPVYTWYFLIPGGNWYVAQYGGSTLVWNTTGAAPVTYKIDVWVSQNGSSTPHESFILISYTIT
jgi:cell wall-associated protease